MNLIRISERVRAGLTTARNKGKRLGRPRVFVPRSRIESLRQEGKSWRRLAEELNTNTATARRAYAAQPSLKACSTFTSHDKSLTSLSFQNFFVCIKYDFFGLSR
jgi:DNA invertase Pin-like site-specific DNA recombinase